LGGFRLKFNSSLLAGDDMVMDKLRSKLHSVKSKTNQARLACYPDIQGRVAALALVAVGAVLFTAVPHGNVLAQHESRIYGVIHTTGGEDFEGFIRWDKNEVGWDNILDGTKDRQRMRSRDERRRKRRDSWVRSLFGSGFGTSRSAQSGVQFGYLERLESDGDNEAIITLKGGMEVELRHGSTDIGDDIREILIEDISQGEIELDWEDIDWIAFSEPDENFLANRASNSRLSQARRLYGTVYSRRGDTFTGFIGWDYDESMTNDILNGSVSGRKRKLKFAKIASIERRGSDGSIVITKDGKKLRMEDSNDVDDSNRGIIISDAPLGRIVVQWDEFDRLELSEPPAGRAYTSYREVKPLYGIVTTEDGEALEGEIIWDADESYSWELLDGDYRDVSFAIVFANISSIEKVRRGSIVTLRDGREFRLRGSNDINRENKGIFVNLGDGDTEEISWEDFARIEFTDN
jgi:hypothetical protein